MAFTRAQFIMGASAQGTPVLPGEPQGVVAGNGIQINSTTGVVTIDTGTVLTLNNPGAFNGYIWPTAAGVAGQSLVLGAGNTLAWSSSGGGIAWTTKGQLIAATGAGADTLVNVGANGAFLAASSAATSGLAYTDSLNTSVLLPKGTTAQQPPFTTAGQIRYNIDNSNIEYSTGTAWAPVGGSVPGLGLVTSGTALKVSISQLTAPPAAGTGTTQSVDGSLYWDKNLGILFIRYNDGTTTQWVQAAPAAGSGGVTGLASGTGISLSGTTGNVTISNAGVTGVTGGTGIQASASVGSITLTNTGVTGITAGTGLNASAGTGPVTLTNTGVTSITAGPNITLSGNTGAITISATASAGGVTSVTANLPLAVTNSTTTPDLTLNTGLGVTTSGNYLKAATLVAGAPPAAGTGQLQAVDGSLYWDNSQGALFVRYNDGTTTQWVQASAMGGGGASGTFTSQDGKTVTVANGLIVSIV